MGTQKPNLSPLLAALPPIVLRKNLEKHLDGFISRGYMANLDSQGRGPKPSKADAGLHICAKTWLCGWKKCGPKKEHSMATFRKRGPYQWEARIRKRGYPPSARFFNRSGKRGVARKIVTDASKRLYKIITHFVRDPVCVLNPPTAHIVCVCYMKFRHIYAPPVGDHSEYFPRQADRCSFSV